MILVLVYICWFGNGAKRYLTAVKSPLFVTLIPLGGFPNLTKKVGGGKSLLSKRLIKKRLEQNHQKTFDNTWHLDGREEL